MFRLLSTIPNSQTKGFREFSLALCHYATFSGYSIPVIRLMLTQARIESANGSSNLALTQNNYIGMRCVQIRNTTQTGCNNAINFGIYSSPSQCAKDLVLWYDYRGINKKNRFFAEAEVIRAGYVTEEESGDYTRAIANVYPSTNLRYPITVLAICGVISLALSWLVFKWLKIS